MRLVLLSLILVAVYVLNRPGKVEPFSASSLSSTIDEMFSNQFIGGEINVKTLAQRLELSPVVYGRYEGIEGRPTIVYATFERLNHLVADSFWLQATHSRSPVMRIYAYDALMARNPTLASLAKEWLKNDTSVVKQISFDLIDYYTVGNYVSMRH